MPLILLVLLMIIILAPQWWVKKVITKYQEPLTDMPGTGGELAIHLLTVLKISDIQVEVTDKGDHYDPNSGIIGLSEAHFSGKSLAAVAIAAHEVGHVIQHKQQMPFFAWRGWLVKIAVASEKIGVLALMAVPFIGGLFPIPHPMIALLIIGIGSLLIGVLVHLITLPVEWDASFNKALPLLIKGEYISIEQQAAVQQILKAAAMTYVAATLASILNISRWLMILRRR